MKFLYSTLFIVLFCATIAQAQMWNGVDSLYGNEWIDFDKSYYKIMVAEDGIYKISGQELSDAGIPINDLEGKQLQLTYMGNEIPIYTSTEEALSTNDFIEFFGKKNRTELDRYLFQNPDVQMLNPKYSMFTDSSAYFLTWTDAPTQRYTNLENDLTNLPPKENSFIYHQEVIYNERFIKRSSGSNNDKNSTFDMSEGFGQTLTNEQQQTIIPQFPISNLSSVDVNLRLTTDQNSHNLSIDINGENYSNLTHPGYTVSDLNYTVPISGFPSVQFSLKGNANDFDKHSISNITLTYPRRFVFDNTSRFVFTIAAGDRKYIEVQNFTPDNGNPILYDLTNHRRLTTVNDNGLIKFVLPASDVPLDLVLTNTNSSVANVSSIKSINFIDYSDMDTEFLIISNKKLFKDGQGNNAVQEYADYRSSVEGGSYATEIVEIQQIYDQFAYGVNRHSIAVKNFSNYANKNWDNWKFALLMGKSREYSEARSHNAFNSSSNATYYLPTYGAPGSDMLMFSPMDKITPFVAVGHLPVVNPNEVRIFLNKLETYEDTYKNAAQTIEARGWMSRVLHLGGGRTAGEQNSIKNNLDGMGRMLTENKFGANITSFYKTTSDPIQTSQSDELTNLINDGVSMITFFGHSSADGFDFSLDNPNNYENIGKYPIISSYGCYAGQIHFNNRSIGEKFMFAPERGAIGFYASVSQGYITDLDRFGDYYYDKLGSEMYGRSVGEIHNAVTQHYENVTGSNSTLHKLLTQTIYQGDPAMKLNPQPSPDYLVDAKSVSIHPSPINIEVVDSVKVDFNVVNIGQNKSDSIVLKVVQELPNNSRIILFNKKVKTQEYSNKYSFNFAVQDKESIGQNKLYITVDADNDVEELPSPTAENNNEFVNNLGVTGLSFFVFSNDARPLYPSKFGITSNQNVTLKATTTNTFIGQQKYFIEIDTTEQFNSAFKASTSIEQEGGLIEWQPNIPFEDNMVYYWRISPDSIADIGFLWQNSSFLFKEDTPNGWNQSHYFQYLENDFEDMQLTNDRDFSFGDDVFSYELRTDIQEAVNPGFSPQVRLNNGLVQTVFRNTIPGGVYVAVMDPNTGLMWENSGLQYGSDDDLVDGPFMIRKGFPFKTATEEDRAELIQFLRDTIPNGTYVAIISIQKSQTLHSNAELWAADSINLGTNLFQVLEQQGAHLTRQLINNIVPYGFAYQKNNPAFDVVEELGAYEDIISLKVNVIGRTNSGKVLSPFIGPATTWNKLLWQSSDLNPAFDTEQLSLYGIKEDGEKDLLLEQVPETTYDLSDIDSNTYPYLQLGYATTDETNHTTPQLDYWRVIYTGVPEATLNKSGHYVFHSDTLQQGETLRFELAVDNISDYDMDSLLVKYIIKDANNTEQLVTKRIEPLSNGERITTNFSYDTKNLLGQHVLSIEINPDQDQQEQIHLNNLGFVSFYVEKDKRNPVLDITFDGIHIMNGDLVSPDPLIVINMEDENQYLALSDTALFEVSLVYPDNATREISLNDPAIQFFPSTNANGQNLARLEYSPVFTQEGRYRLLVKGKDVTGNHSGRFDYDVEFEVILEDMISNVINYPNPFSTATHFVYTLTGHSPEFFKLQIMTVGGRIVKEIDQSELGELKVGTHQTAYTWDGTDEFGDRLANGIYLYRMVAQDANGQKYDTYNTAADSYFKNDFGKMVILR